MDLELTIDVLDQCRVADHLVIFSGDGDFTRLVEAVQRRGCKVSVVSTMATRPPMIADELRRQADHFIDLVTLRGDIDRHSDVSNEAPSAGNAVDAKVDQ